MKYRASRMLTVNGATASVTQPARYRHSKLASVFTAFAAFMTMSPSARAALTFGSGYSSALYYTHGNSDGINSYDWGSDGNLYYATATPGFTSGGVYRYDGSSSTTIRAASGDFAGASVVAISSSIYFNDSNFPTSKIYRYNIGDSSTTSISVANYSLATDGTNLLTTGSGATQFNYYAGGVLSGALDLGGVAGGSGPAAFDMAGNLFYAPGYGDTSIYRWSAAEVAAAVLGGGSPQLAASGHQWVGYGGSFTGAGASSLLLDANGNVFVTLTDFVNPSSLVRFDANGSGSFETILTSTDRLGELRLSGGNLFMSDANRIITIIPEPSTMFIALSGLALILRRKR